MRNMDARLRRLERETTGDDAFPRHYVLWDDEEWPDHIRAKDLVVRLNHKAPSVAQWVEDVRRRNPAGGEGGRP